MNDSNITVGDITDRRARTRTPVMVRDGQFIDLTLPSSGGQGGSALGVNRAGMVVGSQDGRAFIHDGQAGRFIPVGLPGQTVRGQAINDRGVVLGTVSGRNRHFTFLWDGGEVTRLPNFSGGYALDARDFNDSNAVVGTVTRVVPGVGGVTQTYLWADGRYRAVGSAGTGSDYLAPYAINERNWVVGATTQGGDALEAHAFLWRNGRAVDLNDLVLPDAGGGSWHLGAARDINDRGQIVGVGDFNGSRRAFLATPVPEPGTWAQTLAGLALLGGWVRRRVPAQRPAPDLPNP